ncbi:MAG: hypothetical protein ABRQ38_18750 [Candidatus Eremiobacterota bacterium]
MNNDDIKYAITHSCVLRQPQQKIATFGVTNIKYFIITDPIINNLIETQQNDLILREGQVIAERPQIITPYYLNSLFQGFDHGDEYTEFVRENYSENNPGLLYKYKNEFKNMSVVSGPLDLLVERLEQEIEKEGDNLSTIIKGVNTYWDISLMKFIFELTTSSLANNILDLNRRGLLNIDNSGVPGDAKVKIENLFREVKAGRVDPKVLKKELDLWGVFKEYENRFLDLFTGR